MPPPSLSSEHDRELQAEPGRGEQAADVVGERDVADQQHRGPVRAAAATPKAVETVPSIPFAPRLASTRGGRSRAGKNVSTSRTGIEDATTSVALARQPRAELGRHARLAQPARAEHRRRSPRPPRRSARRQPSSHALSRRRLSRSPTAASVVRGSAATIVATAPAGSCQAPSGSNATWSASSSPCSHWRSGLEVGRSPTRSDEVGRVRGAPRRRRAAARRSGRPPRRRGGRRTAGRRAAGSPARSAKRGERGAELRVALGAAGDEHGARPRCELGARAPSTERGAGSARASAAA